MPTPHLPRPTDPSTGEGTVTPHTNGSPQSGAVSRHPRLVGVVGDPHAEHEVLAAALSCLTAAGAQVLLCVGDVLDGPGDENRTIDLLREHDVRTVNGNHDRWRHEGMRRAGHADHPCGPLAEAGRLAWLRAQPATLELETGGGRLMLCHGVDDDDMNHLKVDDYGYAVEQNQYLQGLLARAGRRLSYLIKGHTHRPGIGQFGDLRVLDAGTLLRRHGATAWLLDPVTGHATCWTYDGTGFTSETVHRWDAPAGCR